MALLLWLSPVAQLKVGKYFPSGYWLSGLRIPERRALSFLCPRAFGSLWISECLLYNWEKFLIFSIVICHHVHALRTAHASWEGLEWKCTCVCQTICKSRQGFGGNPFPPFKRTAQRQKFYSYLLNLDFQSFPRHNNAFS